MKDIIEALLIATDAPLAMARIMEIVNCTEDQVRLHIEELNREYRESNRAFEIKEIAGGYQIYTLPQFADWVGKLKQKKEKLSKAALETLAIIAYHQPITRGEVEKARGVDSSWILESLMEKGLIKTCGRLQTPGRPIKYGTTNEFLRYFGIRDLSDLPREEDFGETATVVGSEQSASASPQAPDAAAEGPGRIEDEEDDEEFKDLAE
jgi:segregation and condensation protein B